MVCCTYISANQANAYKESIKDDKDLVALIAEVSAHDGKDWIVYKHTRIIKRWFLKNIFKISYALYWPIQDDVEYQVINFAPELVNGYTINTYVTRPTIMAYLHGYLCGIDSEKRKK